jgi:hypothetical protein
MKNFARWPGSVFEVGGKGLLDVVILVFAAQLFFIGCGSSLNKKDNDAGTNADSDSSPSNSAGKGGTGRTESSGGTGGSGGASGSGGTGGSGETSDGGGMGGASGLGEAGGSGGSGGIGDTDFDRENVSAGPENTCAIKNNGTLFCWGLNLSGELGNNSISYGGDAVSLVPVQESTSATDWARVSMGGNHTCAIKTNGTLFCWGSNDHSQLGNNLISDGAMPHSLVPVQESTSATDWARVSAGAFYTCAIKTNGTLFCWGANDRGQLGNNS